MSGAPPGVDCDWVTSRHFVVDLFFQLFDASGAWDCPDDIDVGDPRDYDFLCDDRDVDPDDEAARAPTPDPLLTPETLPLADERLQDVRWVEIYLRRRWRA